MCEIDLMIFGGFHDMLYLYRVAGGVSGPEGGGLENCNITIRSGAGSPGSTNGVFIRGWANSSRINVYLHGGCVAHDGYGVYLDGTYPGANGCMISGTIQGAAGMGVKATGIGQNLHIQNLWCEAMAQGDIKIYNHHRSTIGANVNGWVYLSGCRGTYVNQISGSITLDAYCYGTILGNIDAEAGPAVTIQGVDGNWPIPKSLGMMSTYYQTTDQPGVVGPDTANLVMNGDFHRVSTTPGPDSIWGSSSGGGNY